MREINLLMVDDHSLFRESLSRMLEAHTGFRVVGMCATVSEAMAAFARTRADVVLLDYDLGEETGYSLIAALKNQQRDARVLMVTAGLSDDAALQAIEAGASGIFLKHGSSEQLVQAIQRIADGEVWLDNSTVHCLLAGKRSQTESQQRTVALTDRQSQVLRGILDGLANKEIAWTLKVSESSVKAVIQELFHKAGVRTRSQLVRIAIEKHAADWLKAEARH
jgi:two-component system, NarL family, nitrate/nitrite response regulator NarL